MPVSIARAAGLRFVHTEDVPIVREVVVILQAERPVSDAQGVIFTGFNNTIGTQAAQPGVIGTRVQIREGTVPGTTFQLGIRSNSATPAGSSPPWPPRFATSASPARCAT